MTEISGKAISDYCMWQAAILNLDIYDTAESDLEPELAKALREVRANWTRDPGLNFKDPDGYCCALYLPKSGGKGKPLCPPALVYRGSDTEAEDFSELAFSIRLAGTYAIDFPRGSQQTDLASPFGFDSTFSANPAFNGKKMSEMSASGLTAEPLFVGVTETLNRVIDGPMLFNVDLQVSASLDATLYYGANGDWAVNFSQGLGTVPAQYKKAIQHAKIAAKKAMQNWDGRLIITGHSLGGGLASAGAIAARISAPELRIRSTTYNAAGLHAKTAKEAGGSLATASNVPIRALHVKDEILNSMQASSRMVPFLADFLAWGKKAMPPAVANPSAQTGKGFGKGSFSKIDYAPKGAGALPVLFTLDRQTLVPPTGVTIMGDILAIANRSTTPNAFVRDLIDDLGQRVFPNWDITYGEGNDLWGDGAPQFTIPEGLAKLLTDAIMSGGPVPTIAVTGGAAFLRQRLDTLFSQMLRDIVVLARVMLASGEFHTFPACAFTFLLPPPPK